MGVKLKSQVGATSENHVFKDLDERIDDKSSLEYWDFVY